MGINDIYIIGNGGFAKEVYFLLEEIGIFNVKGFVDHQPKETKIIFNNKTIPIFDEDFFLKNMIGETIVIGIGKPNIIDKVFNKYKNFKKPNIIHPNFIGHTKNISMGDGNIITAGVIFTTNIKIGSFNVFNLNTTIGHDTIIGDCNVFNPSCNISGNNNIGNKNLFGVGSISLENIVLGDNNIIGASALITKKINNNGVYIGIPAKFIKNNEN